MLSPVPTRRTRTTQARYLRCRPPTLDIGDFNRQQVGNAVTDEVLQLGTFKTASLTLSAAIDAHLITCHLITAVGCIRGADHEGDQACEDVSQAGVFRDRQRHGASLTSGHPIC